MRVLNLPVMIEWGKFEVGNSLFIPCLNRTEVEQYLQEQGQRIGFKLTTKQVIAKGCYGVRVWRTE